MATTAPHRPHRIRPSSERAGIEVVLWWLEGLLAVGAVGGALGFWLLGERLLGDATARLPFASPILAGVALLLVNGLLPTAVLVGTRRGVPLVARAGHLAVGVALIGWIVVQVGYLGWPPAGLQWAYLLYGVLITTLALRLRRRRHRSVGWPPS
jgi:hypothetical protein